MHKKNNKKLSVGKDSMFIHLIEMDNVVALNVNNNLRLKISNIYLAIVNHISQVIQIIQSHK